MKLNYIITKIKEYKVRYETGVFNPELNNLLNEIIKKLNEINDL